MNRKMSQKISEKFANFGIIVACLVIVYPIFLMVSLSLKTNGDLLTNPFGISYHFQWQNYTEATKQMNYWQTLYNSAIITGFAAVLVTFFSALTAYALARAPRCKALFRGLGIFFWLGIALPVQTVMVPLTLWMKNLGLANTKLGLILVFIASNAAFGVFFFTGFVQTVPIDLEEAAMIDGAGKFTIFRKIVFPLLQTPLVTLFIIMVLRVYNNFIFPLILLQGKNSRTLPLTVYFFKGDTAIEWNIMFAATTLVVLPLMIVYFVFQRRIREGMLAGSVKM